MKYASLLFALLLSFNAVADVTAKDIAKAKARYSIVLDMQYLMRSTAHCMATTALTSEDARKHQLADTYYRQCMERFGDIANMLPAEFKVRAIKHYHRVVNDIVLSGTAKV